jgi:Tol biopolymer transport system component
MKETIMKRHRENSLMNRTIRFTKLLRLAMMALLFWITTTGVLLAQQGLSSIVYNRLDPQGYLQLWAINPDGSGNQQLPVGAALPVWSRDGQWLAVSSPARPNVVSWNVFAYNPQTRAAQQVTRYEDMANTDTGRSSYVLALYKAFSPDGRRMAVSSFYNVLVNQGAGNSSSNVTPVLEVYGLDGTQQALAHIGSNRTFLRGNGVDWSPNQDVLAYPVETDDRRSGGPVTALFALRPVNDATTTGRQITFPSNFYTSWEEDIQPAFSPNGQQVAYVRVRIDASTFNGYVATPSLRIVNLDGTNDRELIRFQPGNWIAHVSWSPDGSRLVFDLGQQDLPQVSMRFSSMSLFTINTNGAGLRPIQGPPSFFPSWNPRAR